MKHMKETKCLIVGNYLNKLCIYIWMGFLSGSEGK